MDDQTYTKLKSINDRLWPADYKSGSPVALTPTGKLSEEEWVWVKSVIAEESLVTEMFSANMFGGYGMRLYTHPVYPGAPTDQVLCLVEGNLPGDRPEKVPGCGCDRAWEEFSQFTHSEKNREWLRTYKKPEPRSRGYYDY